MALEADHSAPSAHAVRRAIVVGSSGGIGAALVQSLEAAGYAVDGLARTSQPAIDITGEASIAAAAGRLVANAPYELIIVATGLLQDGAVAPEKSMRDLSAPVLLRYFEVNAVGPALVAKHFVRLLPKTGRCIFAVLSARVGSITDNRLGGWYGYRASKAALNMFMKTLSIEVERNRPEAICVALHPGTVDTALSKPFQRGVPAERLFSPHDSAAKLLGAMEGLTPEHSGDCFAWNGERILP